MPEQDERRAFSRIHVQVDADVVAGSTQILSNRTKDISFDGLYVYAPRPLPPGSVCTITLHGAGGQVPTQLQVEGRVTHTDDKGMGVEFIGELDADSITQLRNLLLLNAPDPDAVEGEFYAHVTRRQSHGDTT